MIKNKNVLLFLCGALTLYWELALIRWLGTSVRIVAYYSNFVLIASFFGLGLGALLARFRIPLHILIYPLLSLTILCGAFLFDYYSSNPSSGEEFWWAGKPLGIESNELWQGHFEFWQVMIVVYIVTSAVFVVFGQWLGHLFQTLPALRAYSVEIAGSICGILCFSLLAALHTSPVVWFSIGFFVLALIIPSSNKNYLIALFCSVITLAVCAENVAQFYWSPYYKISLRPLENIYDLETKQLHPLSDGQGYELSVNNDYHQLILNLKQTSKGQEHDFFSSWRDLYDLPYQSSESLPPGPIMIVGSGTGNDVAAALRNTTRQIHAVEIDKAILRLGKKYHPEQPYANPRVTIINDDARSYFQKTQEKYSLVVFGFLDSHTLLSSFSSLRLDNFVYTKESLEQVKRLLLPGGKVFVTFASNTDWLDSRLENLVTKVFEHPTQVVRPTFPTYSNGIVYSNSKDAGDPSPTPMTAPISKVSFHGHIPTDDWPFLYLKQPQVPSHYWVFLAMIILLAPLGLLTLPKGQRQVRLAYFFMGAAFFLVETSNVVGLSLLYGSTWVVNVVVFTGILTLILFGNWTAHRLTAPRMNLIFCFLGISLAIAYLIPPSFLLALPSSIRMVAAILVFLSPVYFASIIFATLIKNEANFYQAYGSNILGATIGGATEYLSLSFGFKFLLLVTFLFYFIVYLQVRPHRLRSP